MALLSTFTLPSSLRFSCSSQTAAATPTGKNLTVTLAPQSHQIFEIHVRPIDVTTKCFSGVRISPPFPFKRTAALVVRAASADADGVASADGGESPLQGAGELVPVDKLPLESKLRERAEQRLRMKMAKKIRLRRKRLVRKHRLRKKGRWPPSKMKKLRNV